MKENSLECSIRLIPDVLGLFLVEKIHAKFWRSVRLTLNKMANFFEKLPFLVSLFFDQIISVSRSLKNLRK